MTFNELSALYPELSPLQAVLKLAGSDIEQIYEFIVQHPENCVVNEDFMKKLHDDLKFIREAVDMFNTSRQLNFNANDIAKIKNSIIDSIQTIAYRIRSVEDARIFLNIVKLYVDFCS